MSNNPRPSEAKPPIPSARPMYAAKPTRNIFDPWNSCSLGHQRAENRLSGSLEWRNARTKKLQDQLGDKEGRGGRRSANEVGIVNVVRGGPSTDRDPIEPPSKSQETLYEAFDQNRTKKGRRESERQKSGVESEKKQIIEGEKHSAETETNGIDSETLLSKSNKLKPIFHNLNFYINGSTFPLISDHKLKKQLVAHGARVSLHQGRRTITHVIVGVKAGASNGHDIKRPAGGVLSGRKIQKETAMTKSAGFRYVSVEWVLECLKRGRRVPEADFAPDVGIAGRGQRSVLGIMQQGMTKDAVDGASS